MISFSTAKVQFTVNQLSIISKAQTSIKFALASFQQRIAELNLKLSITKINVFTIFKSRLETVKSILTGISINSNVNVTLLSNEETSQLVQIITNVTAAPLGKI